MKKSIVIVLMSILVSSAFSLCMAQTTAPQENKNKTTTSDKQQPTKVDKDVYTCPMHAGVKSDKPGKCPECKMNLVKKDAVAADYICPMHPEIKKDKPGKCTKCGMNLEKKETKKSNNPQKM